ncbi:folate family ECF transporter S component [Secundilactobacillus oryzae]|uniref:folate family ECF transporter S component n=1 Tax=Secundilactobacillus oryzae TaxID=1202668 RepID=UPI00350E4B32
MLYLKTLDLGLNRLSTRKTAVLGVLMALQLILSRFSLSPTPMFRLSFTFVATVLMAIWVGPLWASAASALTDIIGTLMMGTPYFVGFTISAMLGAFIYGVFLYEQKPSVWRIIASQILVALIVNLVLNTLWLTLMYQTPFWALLPARGLKELISTPIQIIIVYIILKNSTVRNLGNRL